MASNFSIRHHRHQGDLHLNLIGDFDGSSAFELSHCLHKALKQDRRIVVHTDSLSRLVAFGCKMFQKQFSARAQESVRVLFTGAYAPAMAPDGCRTHN